MSAQDQSQDPELQLFAKQEKIYPKRVSGRYRNVKWAVMIITLGIYYLAPFLRWDRGPNVPDQAILIDMPARRAYFFFIEIWPQEVYFLTGILIVAAVALFVVTSMFGRVWCGYLCPQTVWTDLYVWVERIVQGDRVARKRLSESKWTFEKAWKLTVTHFIWIIIGALTGGAFVLYFNDAPTLMMDLFRLDLTPTVWGFIGGLTFSTYLMAGYAREQVCTFMCPYARFQSAMFDKDSLIIGYDADRGEARGKYKKGDSWEGRGHCVDCTACVQVCPMGIDIRDGLQIQCIACGLCVDACNNIMDKLELPRGLVRYDTERNQELRKEGKPTPFHVFRLRTLYYMGIMALVGGLMLYALVTRAPLELHALHDRNPLFVMMSDGTVRNGYEIHISNKTHDDKRFTLTLEGLEGYELDVRDTAGSSPDDLFVAADKVGDFRVFVKAKTAGEARRDIIFSVTDKDTGLTKRYKSFFVSQNP